MTTRKTAERQEQPGFEAALNRLEALVAEMEAGQLSLEELIGRFEEGQKLLRLCHTTLNEVERKVELLVNRDGKVAAEPFVEVPDLAAGEPRRVPDAENAELF